MKNLRIPELHETWAMKMKLKYCRCEHANTIHAGGVGECSMAGCTCGEFKEKLPTTGGAPSTFKDVKAIMEEPMP